MVDGEKNLATELKRAAEVIYYILMLILMYTFNKHLSSHILAQLEEDLTPAWSVHVMVWFDFRGRRLSTQNSSMTLLRSWV